LRPGVYGGFGVLCDFLKIFCSGIVCNYTWLNLFTDKLLTDILCNVFIRIKSSPTTKKKYLQVCKSFRKEGKVSQKVVGSLGAVNDLIDSGEIEKLAASLLNLVGKSFNSSPEIKEIKRLQWGASKLIQTLWKIFKLDDFVKSQKLKITFDFKAALLLLLIDRFLNPRSKLKTFEKQSNFWGIKTNLDLQHLYRSLDTLADLKVTLEKHLFEINSNLFNMKVNIVFFDATTLYFESDKADDLRKFGFSKDCMFKDVQVVLGLLMDEEGRPIGFESFPGNTFDGKTLIKALGSLKKNFEIEKLILVGDRGICSKVNLEEIKKLGYEYIIASSLKKQSRAIKDKVLDQEGYKPLTKSDLEDLTYKEIKLNDSERLISTWSSKRAKKDAYEREILIKKAKEILEGEVSLKKPGKAKYLALEQKTKYLDEAKILEDKKWDGYYGIQSNNLKMSQEEIYEAYHQLWKIEDCFRVLKSHLKIRPIFHWNQKRIEGHLTLCFLAFVFERHLEIELRRQGLEASPAKIRDSVYEMQASLVEINQREYLMRSEIPKLAKDILKTFNITAPQELSLLEDF